MRNLTGVLVAGAALFLLVTVVLPVLGFLLAAVVAVLALGAVAYLASPLLARLPWFRDRIRVEQRGRSRTIRFGRTAFTSYQGWDPGPRAARRDEDVIDVEGRPLAEEEGEEPQLPPGWRG